MAVARFGELCLDANDPARLGRFWAGALDRQWRPDDWGAGGVFGPTPGHTLWFDKVAERKVVKHRVHLDIYTTDIAQLQELGASVVLPEGDDRDWIVMADPEGGEFCADLRAEVPVDRLHGLVFDSIDPPPKPSGGPASSMRMSSTTRRVGRRSSGLRTCRS